MNALVAGADLVPNEWVDIVDGRVVLTPPNLRRIDGLRAGEAIRVGDRVFVHLQHPLAFKVKPRT